MSEKGKNASPRYAKVRNGGIRLLKYPHTYFYTHMRIEPISYITISLHHYNAYKLKRLSSY